MTPLEFAILEASGDISIVPAIQQGTAKAARRA